MVKRLGSIDRL